MQVTTRGLVTGLVAFAALGGCYDTKSYPVGGGATADLRLAQTAWSTSSVRLKIGSSASPAVAPGAISAIIKVPVGTQSVQLVTAGGTATGSTRMMTFEQGQSYFLVAQDSAGVVVPTLLADTNAIPVPGKSKVRVIHSATMAPAVDIWRRQPDYDTLIRFMFPFPYRGVTPYYVSDPGDWHVTVSHENQTDTLYASAAIAVGDGKLITVIVVDSSASGGVTAVIVPDN